MLWDCLAYRNEQNGFSSNSNPESELHRCSSFENGRPDGRDNFVFYCFEQKQNHAWVLDNLYPPVTADGKEMRMPIALRPALRRLGEGDLPRRGEDGSACLSDRMQRTVHRHRAGALINRDQKKNILMIIATLGGGGAERVTTILAGGLSGRHHVHLLYMYKKA